MSEGDIRQHKRLAMGESLVEVPAIETPFKQCCGEQIPRGELKDSKRGASKDGDIHHNYDYDYVWKDR